MHDEQADAASGAREVPATGESGRIGKDNYRPMEGARRPFIHRESYVRSGARRTGWLDVPPSKRRRARKGWQGGQAWKWQDGALLHDQVRFLWSHRRSRSLSSAIDFVSGHGFFREVS